MRRQRLHFDNLGETLASAKNAARLGNQQFETPEHIAEALAELLPPVRPVVTDLQCGHGNLLRAAANTTTHTLLGLDIDPTASITLPNPPPNPDLTSQVIHGDICKVFPLLEEVTFRTDLIVANPPFSLQWPADFLSTSGPSTLNTQPSTAVIDSTLATWHLTHRLLTTRGEALFICNASTAERLLVGTPEWKRVWLHLTLPNFFPGTAADMRIAAIYIAANHSPSPLSPLPPSLPLASADPGAIRNTLATISRDKLIRGSTIRRDWQAIGDTPARFAAVRDEWRRRTDDAIAAREGFNIRLDREGRIDCYLTPFQTLSGSVPVALAEQLQKLHGHHPEGLVVQRASRKALLHAVRGNIWRVHPDVLTAVDRAVSDYNAIRAPFAPLNPVQRLGYLDEEDTIRCLNTRIPGFTPGNSYPIETETFEGEKLIKKKRPGQKSEHIQVTGQELLIKIRDDNDHWHAFTQFLIEPRPGITERHTLSDLVETFHIPEVLDVAQANPEQFQTYLTRLQALEAA